MEFQKLASPLSLSQFKELNDKLIEALRDVTLADLLSIDSYLLKYERPIHLEDINVLLLDEYFFNLEVSLYKRLGIEATQIRYRKKYYSHEFKDLYSSKTNRLLADFYEAFSFPDGSTNWDKLLHSMPRKE